MRSYCVVVTQHPMAKCYVFVLYNKIPKTKLNSLPERLEIEKVDILQISRVT